jgi:hypothetical protein
MRHTFIVRALFFLFLGASFLSFHAAAQSNDTSVADAARRAREKKKTVAKPSAVITNDTLPAAPPTGDATVSSPQADAQPNSAATPALQPQRAPVGETPEDASKKKADVEALKQEIAEKLAAADVEQREIALDSDTFYSNPDHEHDKDGKAKLDSMQADVQQKQAEVTRLKAKLASLAPAGALPADSTKQ